MMMGRESKKQKKMERTSEKSASVERVTLELLDAVSSDESESGSARTEWNAEALALRKAISEGAFDHLLSKKEQGTQSDDDEIVEIDLDSDEDDVDHSVKEEVSKDSEEWERAPSDLKRAGDDDQYQSEEDSSNEDRGSEAAEKTVRGSESTGKALLSVFEGLHGAKKGMPWAEAFSIVHDSVLSFSSKNDVHDDLKRELAFYNIALDAASGARIKANTIGIPFSRPEDFFAEMVKSDDHMAKVKDRLIFETKKMDAVAQRKSNKEQQLRAKEKQANKLSEKSKRKKEHLQAVDDWAKAAAHNRGSAMREDDSKFLGKLNNKRGWTDREGSLQFGPNKKRESADKKFGFGGKRGRFKQNDPKSLNDMSSFNPKGNFGGPGSKSKGGSGANRKGKRARDAGRSGRK